MKKLLMFNLLLIASTSLFAQQVDYSSVSVPEESGLNLMKITSDNDCVCIPMVKRTLKGIGWFSNKVVDTTPDGQSIGFISLRGQSSNIFIKDLDRRGSAIQRTNRNLIQDFSFSRDGRTICFSEAVGKNNNIFITDAKNGFVCREITSGANDFSPVFSADGSKIFFGRTEANLSGIWSFDIANKFLSSYSSGYTPSPSRYENVFFCMRVNGFGRGEIYKVNFSDGVDECILTDSEKTFTSPQLSPDGRWIVCVGSTKIPYGNKFYWNTDIYACRTDGTDLIQLTYHAADDLSPVWDKSGRYIYFVSQRGSSTATANIWRMDFNL